MKLVVAESMSLDGVVQSPAGQDEDPSGGFAEGGWLPAYFDNTVEEFVGAGFANVEALLLGRRTHDLLAAHWPKLTPEDDPGAELMNATPRYVAGTPKLKWAGTTALEGDVVAAVQGLKDRRGGDLVVQGSPTLVQTLLTAGLIDELRIAIAPVLLGSGKRLFGNGTVPGALELVECTSSPSGIMLAVYCPAGSIRRGNWMIDEK